MIFFIQNLISRKILGAGILFNSTWNLRQIVHILTWFSNFLILPFQMRFSLLVEKLNFGTEIRMTPKRIRQKLKKIKQSKIRNRKKRRIFQVRRRRISEKVRDSHTSVKITTLLKNFVKSTVLLKKLKELIWRNIFDECKCLFSHSERLPNYFRLNSKNLLTNHFVLPIFYFIYFQKNNFTQLSMSFYFF